MNRALCWLLGHRYRVAQEFGPLERRVVCARCGGDWGMHDGVKAFVPWDAELESLYRSAGYYILKF